MDSLLTGANAALLDSLYQQWLDDPESVASDWASLFEGQGAPNGGRYRAPQRDDASIFNPRSRSRTAATATDVAEASQRQGRVARLVNAYRVRGHFLADIDPLQRADRLRHPELTLEYWGLSQDDLDKTIHTGTAVYGEPEVSTLRSVLQRLERVYCGSFGAEFMNIDDIEQKMWVARRVETLYDDGPLLKPEEERRVLEKLADAENFERLIHTRFPGTKRFSLEGGETLIPLLDDLVEDAANSGVREIILGMAHRGRLSTMVNILGKPANAVIAEFQDVQQDFAGSGDVKYHLGYSRDHHTSRGHRIHLNLAFNPSHLEAVDPVVLGRVRAKLDRFQFEEDEPDARDLCMGLLIHGDAAFAGQGLVAEVLQLSELEAHQSGGTVHLVVNNQIGFTTSPRDARSTPYATGMARMLGVPIFHVNGEDPAAVAAVTRLAVEWRQRYHRDVVIDMYCFRKYGHNEGDEPSFTQPLLYEAIRSHPTAREAYSRQLIERGSLTQDEVDAITGRSRERLEEVVEEEHDSYTGDLKSTLGRLWMDYRKPNAPEPDTGYDQDALVELLHKANTVPPELNAHRKIGRLMKARKKIIDGKAPVDWAIAEQAAYATLAVGGLRVRISGQDSARGTFSHRHAVLTDILTGAEHTPLNALTDDQAPFEVYDSLLSENAVLGFEFGYSLDYPDALVVWEAQFGDFANGAQVMIDQFIVATEQKWNRCSGLVMLLPHGYEAQGPEHSSARIERYLMLCAEDNIILANCTTPANFFHLLRRQGLRKTRKPLVVFTPKSLLRHELCTSTLEELATGRFVRVIGEHRPVEDVRRVLLCQGKVYYELLADAPADIALVRVEELYPFPAERIAEECARYPDAEVVWCQEEPRNMGVWPVYCDWLRELLPNRSLHYIGRKPAASPASGSSGQAKREQAALIAEALK
ncbi:MAG: 2-oxoglutarate dehydrogenase E1 component [Proteobacteria bacterium]|nr:2-oxoglutarate dehydrogenase E1 component [Pseudomonadota bacterium]MCP4920048.1 2-oxoglutarate dehydrogenase E1 component [Pseudomonadota bacterium]